MSFYFLVKLGSVIKSSVCQKSWMYLGEFQNCCQLKQNAPDQMKVWGELLIILPYTCWNNVFEITFRANLTGFVMGTYPTSVDKCFSK